MSRKIKLWKREDGQDVTEYAVMLLVIVVLVIGTVKLLGGSASTAFSAIADVFQQRTDGD